MAQELEETPLKNAIANMKFRVACFIKKKSFSMIHIPEVKNLIKY